MKSAYLFTTSDGHATMSAHDVRPRRTLYGSRTTRNSNARANGLHPARVDASSAWCDEVKASVPPISQIISERTSLSYSGLPYVSTTSVDSSRIGKTTVDGGTRAIRLREKELGPESARHQ